MNRFIITFKGSPSRDSMANMFSKYNAKIRHLFQLVPAAAIELEQKRLEELKKEKTVKRVFSDIRSEENEPFPFKFLDSDGSTRYRVPVDFEPDSLSGENRSDIPFPATVVVIDTGVDKEYPPLRGRVLKEFDLTGEGVTDLNGHGTIVASIAAKQGLIGIISIKVGNAKGVFWESDVMAGIEIAHKEAVDSGKTLSVNLSLGVLDNTCLGDCPLCSMASAAAGKLLIVAAAGNRPGLPACPAKAKGVIAVGALAPTGKIADYSATGEIYAPGTINFKVIKG